MATAIIELAKALDITVVAEGVETEAQATFFTGARCDELQGFLFCKPLPVEALERFLAVAAKADNPRRDSGWASIFGRLQAN